MLNIEYHLRKTTARQPDVTIKYKNDNKILLVDIVCPSENKVDVKHAEKLQKYQQLGFEIRERQLGYNVMIIPIVIGCLGGWEYETSDKPNWTTDIRQEENKSDIE